MAHDDRPEDQPLHLNSAEVNIFYHKANQYWSHEAGLALYKLKNGFSLRQFELRNILGRVPPLPDRTTHGLIEHIPLQSKWHVRRSTGCEASEKPSQVPPIQLHWLVRTPTKVTLDGNSFCAWSESQGYFQSNLLAILTLAWLYILSARFVELQGQDESRLAYTQNKAPLHRASESISGFSLDVGDVDSRVFRWFTDVLAPDSGFQVVRLQHDTLDTHAPWETSLVTLGLSFSIRYEKDCGDLDLDDLDGQIPLTSHEALESLIALCNRHAVSRSQLHAALATALLLPTHNYLQLNLTLPSPQIRNTEITIAKLGNEELDQLFNDLPYYITLSCACEVINSSLCGIFWNPHVSCNLVSPWLQPAWDIRTMEDVHNVPGRYAEILALIGGRRAPNIAFLSIAAAISGLMFKVLTQVSSGQPPLNQHAHAWTGVPQSFMDVAGEGPYFGMRSSKVYIRRSDCWRLRKLPPVIDDGLYYRIGPFTPWEPTGFALLKNCPLRVQIHKDCDRHSMTYKGVTWCFDNGRTLEDDLGRDSITPHVFPDRLPDAADFHDIRSLENEDTSIDATIASFRWVLDNGEGNPPEDAYKDPWLRVIYESHSESDTVSSDGNSSNSEAQQNIASSLGSYLDSGKGLNTASTTEEPHDR